MDREGSNLHRMKSPEDNRRKTKLSKMSDEEITAYMLFVDDELSGDDFDSDDDMDDPDFQPEDRIECGETTDTAISQCLDEMEHCDISSEFLNANNFSFNISSIEQGNFLVICSNFNIEFKFY